MDQTILDMAFYQACLKVYRANSHINEAQAWFAGMVGEGDICTLVEKVDVKTGRQSFFLRTQPFEPGFSLAVGDAFHALNCSLDYISTGIMRAAGQSTGRVTFPSHDTRPALRNSFKAPGLRADGTPKQTPANRRVVETFPAFALLLLQTIKPYRGGSFSLWEIKKADGMDKHNLIIPMIAVANLLDAFLIDEANRIRITVSGHAPPTGRDYLVYEIASPGTQLEVKQKGDPSLSIAFPEGAEVFAGDPIIPTLLQCAQLASEAIRIMARHFGVAPASLGPLDWPGREASA